LLSFQSPLFPRGGENRIETKQSGSEELIERVLFREAPRDLLFTWTVLCSILQLQTDGMVEAGMGLDVVSTRVHGVEIGVALMESVSDSWCLQVALDVGSESKAGLVHEHRRHGEKWRRRHLCLPACFGLVIIAAVALVTVIGIQFLEGERKCLQLSNLSG
jgi:hypothetical protein